MKKLVLFVLVFMCYQYIFGQEINFVQNYIFGGDTLEKRQMAFEEFDLQGKNHVWNLKDVKLYKKKLQSKYRERHDSIVGRELCNRVLYQQTKEDVSITGVEDKLMRISYETPEVYLRFPMKQRDSISGFFEGKGTYCEQIPVRRSGIYTTKADSIGKIVLPKGDTLYSVIRLHTERTVDLVFGEKGDERMKMKEEVYRWYADGYRYPILEAMIAKRDDKTIEKLLFYCIPEAQEQLASNDVNRETRESVAQRGDASSEDVQKSRSNEQFTYEISTHDNGITIKYNNNGDAKIFILLAGSQGYIYKRQEIVSSEGMGTVDMSTNGLRRGQYVVYLNINGKSYAEKVSVR